jgi:spermidine synthase
MAIIEVPSLGTYPWTVSTSAAVLEAPRVQAKRRPAPWILILFFISGCPALIYQIVWQRALFATYGTNIESVTIVVTAFMLGLGLGSLLGGRLSRDERLPALRLFGAFELGIGIYGVFSLQIFQIVGAHTTMAPLFAVGLLAFLLVLLPTVLMGATLPFLVAHLVRVSRNVGASVGMLYFVNTLGSAFACLLCARFLMRDLGESGSVAAAAAVNGVVAIAAFVASRGGVPARPREEGPEQYAPPESGNVLLPFRLAIALAAASGFMALSYEILWYRVYSFSTGTLAPAFALLLGAYLEGIALGSLVSKALCSRAAHWTSRVRTIAAVMAGASILGFAVVPAIARMVQHVNYVATLPLVAVAAGLMGALFPLATHLAIAPDSRAGSRMSYLYLSNIVGSTVGTALVGFVLMDFLSMRQISLILLALGVLLGALLYVRTVRGALRAGVITAAVGVVAASALCSGRLFDTIYERMLLKSQYRDGYRFAHLVESRGGVIAVTKNGVVYGGGAYDGRFNTSLVHDGNMLVRAYALAAFHPAPKDVLMIGVSSGSWAQVVVNDPAVERLTAVEINPAYLKLIPEYPEVASALRNPKLSIEIDDGRRWLTRHPDRQFDAIVMNTTLNWRAHTTNLLSTEFLRLARRHLRPGGVLYYNTTGSEEVLKTGVTEFRYGLRFLNFLALSDRPLAMDGDSWRARLLAWRIDGKPVFDLSKPLDRERLEQTLANANPSAAGNSDAFPVEYEASIRQRCREKRIITDDNMGTEWK